MNTSEPLDDPLICNTTPTRYFALVDQFDLLVSVSGGSVRLPREVLDPTEDPSGPSGLVSELAESERYWEKRARSPEAMDNWNRLRALRSRADIDVIDMTEHEVHEFAGLTAPEYLRGEGMVGTLGRGEAAVIAISEARNWIAAIDEHVGRTILNRRSPATQIFTTRELLRMAVAQGLISSPEAQIVYEDMLEKGYRGPPKLWD